MLTLLFRFIGIIIYVPKSVQVRYMNENTLLHKDRTSLAKPRIFDVSPKLVPVRYH